MIGRVSDGMCLLKTWPKFHHVERLAPQLGQLIFQHIKNYFLLVKIRHSSASMVIYYKAMNLFTAVERDPGR